MITNNNRVALYARVSTDMQAEEGKSIQAQLYEMREFAQGKDWKVVAEFIDPGVSGATLNRKGLHALLSGVEKHAFDIVLVHELSRLSHSLPDASTSTART
jgi:site-specific DNA recombinase